MPDPKNTATDTESMERSILDLMLKRLKTTKDVASIDAEINKLYNERMAEANKLGGLEKEMAQKLADQKHIQDQLALSAEKQKAGLISKKQHQLDFAALSSLELIIMQDQLDIQREMNKKLEDRNKLIQFASQLQKVGLSYLSTMVTKTDDLLNNYSRSEIAMLTFVSLVKNAVKIFKEMDEAAAKFRQTMGMTRDQSSRIEELARATAIELGHVGVTADRFYESMSAVANSIGSLHGVTKDMGASMSIMAQQLGISADTSADFLKTMGMVSRGTMESQTHMMAFTQAMSSAAGVPLGAVMKDVASASKTSYQFLSRDPLVLAKAAVEARRMGTSLESATSSAKELINFGSSVRAEMEASVLLGKSFNVQKARELAYSKDIAGLNKEILRLATEANYEQLDPFQQEAVAKALGKTTGELGQIVQAEKEWRRIEAKALSDPKLKEQLDRYKALEKSTKERAKAEAESVEHQLRSKSNAAAITAISQAWHAIMQRLAERLLPAIQWILEGTANVLAVLNKSWVGWVAAVVAGGAIAIGVFKTLSMLVGGIISKLGSGIGKAAEKMLGGIGRGLAILGAAAASPTTWLGIVAILALSAAFIGLAFGISLIMKALPKAAEGFSIFAAALKTLTLRDLGIMVGLAGAMSMMLPVLLPFSVGAAAAGIGFMALGKGLSATVQALKDLQSISLFNLIKQTATLAIELGKLGKAINDIPQVDVEKVKAIGSVEVAKQEKGTTAAPATSTTDQQMLQELQALRKALESGAIRVVIRMGAAEFASEIGRELKRVGTFEPTGRVPA